MVSAAKRRIVQDLQIRARIYELAHSCGARLPMTPARWIAADIQARAKRIMGETTDDVDAARMRALPCWRCQHERARDVRAWLSQSDRLDITQCSPASGLPWLCCKISSVAIRR